jgi:ankyrin repeat protein
MLLTKAADVNAKNTAGDTALHNAALRGRTEIVELLLARGGNIEAKDNAGNTPLAEAARQGHADIVALLREHEARE